MAPSTPSAAARAPRQGSKAVRGPLATLPSQLKSSPPRRQLLSTCSFIVARLFHLLISIYLAVWALILYSLSAVESHELHVQSPRLSTIALTILALLHMYGACKCATSSSTTIPTVAVVPLHATPPRTRAFFIASLMPEYIGAHQDILNIVFNLCEVASQSVRVVELADNFVDVSNLANYASCVIAYATISPWILFVRNTTKKDLLVNSFDCLFSFALSCGLSLYPTLFQILPYALSSNKTIGQDHIWSTRYINLVRTLVISSSVDYVCQVCMHLGTFIALRRVVRSLQRLHNSNRDTASTMHRTLSFVVSNRVIRHALVLNCVVNLTWACILAVLLVRTISFRDPCPVYCPLVVRPIFDLRCNCAYVRINCYTLANNTPEALMDPSVVGTRTLMLQLARCDLPRGLNTSAMAPHTNLFKIVILFSNMTRWDATLPSSVHNLFIRFAPLATLPTVATTNIPSYFYILYIDSCPLGAIPKALFAQMPYLERVILANISLTVFPDEIATL
ncbi:hypothetical protein As57867_005695, partial [Aphanomyces stellatus]